MQIKVCTKILTRKNGATNLFSRWLTKSANHFIGRPLAEETYNIRESWIKGERERGWCAQKKRVGINQPPPHYCKKFSPCFCILPSTHTHTHTHSWWFLTRTTHNTHNTLQRNCRPTPLFFFSSSHILKLKTLVLILPFFALF